MFSRSLDATVPVPARIVTMHIILGAGGVVGVVGIDAIVGVLHKYPPVGIDLVINTKADLTTSRQAVRAVRAPSITSLTRGRIWKVFG